MLEIETSSVSAAHRALVDYFAGHSWLLEPSFLKELDIYSRRQLEAADAPAAFVACASYLDISLLPQGVFKAPERLHNWLYNYGSKDPGRQPIFLLWDGAALSELRVEEAETWLSGPDGNRVATKLTCKETTITLPSEEELFASLPYPVRQKLAKYDREAPHKYLRTFRDYYRSEVIQLLMAARECAVPQIIMSLFEHSGGRQWQCFFECRDRDLPHTGACNFHGQETSQWRHAGCFVVDAETGEISSHH